MTIELKRILAPTDFSEHSDEAVAYACVLSDKFGAELHLLHVLETHASSTPVFAGGLALAPRVPESQPAAKKALERLASGQSAVRATVDGLPTSEILRYANDNHIDLIVMGTHGRSGLAHVILGSVAERVLRHAPCPVFTVRHLKKGA